MLRRILTDAKTGRSHAVLTDPQRRRLADVKSLCLELALVAEDPRAQEASDAAVSLGRILAAEQPGEQEPDD